MRSVFSQMLYWCESLVDQHKKNNKNKPRKYKELFEILSMSPQKRSHAIYTISLDATAQAQAQKKGFH